MIPVSEVIDVIEMGPGRLVGTPVPCARVKMALASKANSLKQETCCRSSGPIGVERELGPHRGARFARSGRFAPDTKKNLSTDSVSAAQGELSAR